MTVPRKIILFHAIKITSNTVKSIPYILLFTEDALQWIKSVILKRYWVALPGKVERSQKNQVCQECPFPPWTTSSSDNGYAHSEMQSGSLGRRNTCLIAQWCSKSVGHSTTSWLIKKSLAFFFFSLLSFQNICARPQHKLDLSCNYNFSWVQVRPEEL